ncbi:MAG: hypothetical protein ACI8TX_000317 [Hyphomicrobiaceae bacterium]|jgi:hypothetical protein
MPTSPFSASTLLAGAWRQPVQMLAEQNVGGRSSIHDDATAQKVGFQGGTIEGPTHFSQFDPLGFQLFGQKWFEQGCISARYRNACVEGEEVQAWALPSAGRASSTQAGMQKRDGSVVLTASVSVGANDEPTEVEDLLARLRPADKLLILSDIRVGMTGAEPEEVIMDFDQKMGALYPFTLRSKLKHITEPCAWYTEEGAADSPWGRPIIPFEMISVLAQYTASKARFPIKPSVGLFVNQEIRLVAGPLFVGERYRVERQVIALSESKRAESMWVRSSILSESDELVASIILNTAAMKASYENYDTERAALT